jgi:hypothetical protein
MDARDALTSDVRDIFGGDSAETSDESPILDAVDVLPSPDARAAREENARREFRDHVWGIGARLGFEVRQDGSWVSPTGIVVLVRDLPARVTLAAAAHFVQQLQDVVRRAAKPDLTSVLFVTHDRDAADVFKVAIRQARAYAVMRVACLSDLEMLARLVEKGTAAHDHALALIAPIAAVDVGEVLAVLRADLQSAAPERSDA